jgi:hypothetical protein
MGRFPMFSVLSHDTVDHVVEGGHLHACLEQIPVIIAVAKPVPAARRIDFKDIRIPLDRKIRDGNGV